MRPGGLPSPTKRQQALHLRLRDEIGCAVCLFHLRIEGSVAEIHHLLEGGQRISHNHVIPLCPAHHRGQNATQCRQIEPGFTYRHSDRGADGGLAAFEAAYGAEMDLLVRCEEWLNDYYVTGETNAGQAEATDDRDADTDADLESDTRDVGDGAQAVTRFDSPVRIHCHHYRHRLADPDGISIKAAIDGIVKAGLLRDDSAKEIEEISHRQEKIPASEPERTVFEIEEVMPCRA